MILAHASDLHVLDLKGVAPWRYLNKRLTGLVSLALARKSAHPPHIAERLVSDLLDIAPDHVLVTGDLTNLALEPEFTWPVHKVLASLAVRWTVLVWVRKSMAQLLLLKKL